MYIYSFYRPWKHSIEIGIGCMNKSSHNLGITFLITMKF